MLKKIYNYGLATLWYRLPRMVRRKVFAGPGYVCPICNSQVRRFLQFGRSYQALCPVCRAERRHRLVWLFLMRQTKLGMGTPTRLLHVAPEPALAPVLRELPGVTYLTTDRYLSGVDVRTDLMQIGLADASCDLIYCSHVLEHVLDDRQALRELRRVLRPDGYALILVPITAPATFGDPSITDPRRREQLFGQHDHVRRYGPDVVQLLEACGFAVEVHTATQLLGATADQFGVSDKDPLFFCRPNGSC